MATNRTYELSTIRAIFILMTWRFCQRPFFNLSYIELTFGYVLIPLLDRKVPEHRFCMFKNGMNLLNNAVKYTPEGGEVRVGLKSDDHQAVIAVADTGMGIPPEAVSRIFDRFFRVDKSRSRAEGGAGLGLPIARWIAEAHGGGIAVQSEPGRGSTFTVSLPMMTSTIS